jgi:signal transduction histidine kinase
VKTKGKSVELNDKHVLIIDDSTTVRNYLQKFLTSMGAVTDSAATGQEGLEKCGEPPYDLILLDILLPDIDGIEVLEKIREKNNFSTVIMITGHGGVKSAIAAIQLGADGYLQKQEITSTRDDHTEFLYAIEQALEHRAGIIAQEQLQEIRADFYSMVTHDLRSPTSTILTAAEMLDQEDAQQPPSSSEQRQLIRLIHNSANKLFRLINDYLEYAKIEAGYLHLNLKDVELRQLVENSAELAQLQAQAKQQSLTLNLPPTPVHARVDAERLTQVFDNLFSNAIKYTPDGGQVTVEMQAKHEHVEFRIIDTGIGISAKQLPALFTKYHRVPGEATRGIHGTGLGLLIVKEIITAHGGTVRAESQGQDQGSTFIITLPLANG